MSRASLFVLLMLLLSTLQAAAVSPQLQAARATTDADSALLLYHTILEIDGRTGEGPEALAGLLDYFCFTRQADSLSWYKKAWHSEYNCPGLDLSGDCWRVQLGAFAERDNAFRMANSLRKQAAAIEVLELQYSYLVVSSCYASKRKAKSAARSWQQEGYINDFMLRKFEQ